MQRENEITKMNIDLLIPNPNQPRKYFDDNSLKELAISIKEYGILNPILVRKKDNLYEIVAGERRYRAAKLIDLKEVPVIIKEVPENKVAEIALIENLQRENITPIEEAKSYQEILKISSLKEQDLSNIIGKSQSYISNKIRLLKLPSNVQEALSNKKISERHARALINVDNQEKQAELLNRVIKDKLTVKELEKIINENDITEEEIKSAIDDIMKSLNINLDSNNQTKKEKRESDNMNNGNFFPNQQNNVPNGNMTLNTMNMQSLNQQPGGVTENKPFVYNQPVVSEPQTPAPETVQNFVPTPEVPNPIPNFEPQPEVPNPIPNFEVQPEVQNPIPNFEAQPIIPETPIIPTEPVMPSEVVPESTMGVIDQPLFNPNASMAPTLEQPVIPESVPNLGPVPTPAYEVPVTTEMPLPEPQSKLTEVENYLTNNGINYKKYSNETGNCIIIEL